MLEALKETVNQDGRVEPRVKKRVRLEKGGPSSISETLQSVEQLAASISPSDEGTATVGSRTRIRKSKVTGTGISSENPRFKIAEEPLFCRSVAAAIANCHAFKQRMTFNGQHLRSKGVAFSRVDLGLLAQEASLRPFDPSVAISVLRANESILQMETHLDVSIRVLCREHMIRSTISWVWLRMVHDQCYSTSCSILAHQNSDEPISDWLTLLVKDIRSHLLNRSNDFDLEASKYLPGLAARFQYHRNNVPMFANDGDQRVANVAISAIKEWLNYPTAASAEAKALFISRLLADWGASSLLLEETWTAFMSVHRLVFPNLRRKDVPSEVDLDRLSCHLRSSPLANPESPERKSLDEVAGRYEFKDEFLIQFSSRSVTARTHTYRRSLPRSR